ncbi:NHL repeat-containing protein [Engelhardtia mirabilis]|uniref:Serine/threonine-protein kinase PknD n=1 Tax=Engelhardtia mirabilis TaxID=2528011 RepID=A0A518BSA3_9BACT|nr:Serine/threonine-protein kinase PknD [Planctomycetes bacterium Pla133]QDV04174.1 Serine/threonine-protein kinase PknD [Planctomycetes bacterium Pla86]
MIASALLLLAVAQAGESKDGPPPAPEGRLGPFVRAYPNLRAPMDVELLPDGSLWVLESDGHRVSHFEARAGRIGSAGSFGDGAGELRFPRGLAIDTGGDLLVSDTENDRVVRFSAGGEFERVEVGLGGAVDLGLRWPEGLDARAGRLGLCDRGNRRVVVIEEGQARFLGLGGPLAAGGLLDPIDLCFLDDEGSAAVADAGLHEVVVYDAEGAERLRFGGFGHFPGQFSRPSGLDFVGGRLYVADSDNHRVQVFTPGGELLYEWGKHALAPGQGDGHLHYPGAVAMLENGLAAVVAEAFAGRVQYFGPAVGPPELYRTDPATLGADSSGHVGPVVAAAGRLVATIEPETQEVHLHDLGSRSGTPILVCRAGGFGDRPGQFRGLVDVALSADGERLLALDGRDRRLSEFQVGALGEDGPRMDRRLAAFARSIDLTGLVPDLASADALALAPDGRVLVMDAAGRRVIEVAADWGSARTLSGERVPAPRRGVDLALDKSGRLALADQGERAVLIVDADGVLVARIDDVDPGGIAFDAQGRLLVTDRVQRALRIFTPREDGGFAEAGSLGRGMGAGVAKFREPRGVALGQEGRLVVIDFGNHLLTIVEADGRLVGASGPRAYLDELVPKAGGGAGEGSGEGGQ